MKLDKLLLSLGIGLLDVGLSKVTWTAKVGNTYLTARDVGRIALFGGALVADFMDVAKEMAEDIEVITLPLLIDTAVRKIEEVSAAQQAQKKGYEAVHETYVVQPVQPAPLGQEEEEYKKKFMAAF